MMRSFAVLAGLVSSMSASAAAQDMIESDVARVDIRLDGKLYPGVWPLGEEDSKTSVEPPAGGAIPVCVEASGRASCAEVARGDVRKLGVRYQGRDYFLIVTGARPAAQFDAAYRAANLGKVRISIPEAYELVNIAIALTPYAEANPGVVARENDYYRDVVAHFGKFRSHPFVAALNESLTKDPDSYFGLKTNGNAFVFSPQGTLERSPVYDRVGSNDNKLLPFLQDMRSFAADSGFRKFYAGHRAVYKEQVDYLESRVGTLGMISWLRGNFPAVEDYQTYNIIFSPLVGFNQSLVTLNDDGYRELQPHVNFPYPVGDREISAGALPIWDGAILFTELNHGFINPTSEPFAERIAAALAKRGDWAAQGSTADEGYGGSQPLFDEMMNWALVSLYMDDHAPAADRETLIKRVESIMLGRGFVRFEPFNRFLLDAYRRRAKGKTLADLYEPVVAWTEGGGQTGGTPGRP